MLPPSKKPKERFDVDWNIRDTPAEESTTKKFIKGGLPPAMQEHIYDKEADYYSMGPEEWLELLVNPKIKGNRKRSSL